MKESFAFYADVSWFVSNLESACQVNVIYFIIIIFFCGHDESMNLKSEHYLFHILFSRIKEACLRHIIAKYYLFYLVLYCNISISDDLCFDQHRTRP